MNDVVRNAEHGGKEGAPFGNQNNAIHGGEGGRLRLQEGKPLVGLAHESELAVIAELESEGRAAIVRRAAIRTEAVARLFYAAIEKAASEGNLKDLERFAQRYGWLQANALRAWAQLAQEEKSADRGASAKDVLSAIRSETKEKNNGQQDI